MAFCKVHLKSASNPKIYHDALCTYTKEGFYCIVVKEGKETIVDKYPMENIFRISESYSFPGKDA